MRITKLFSKLRLVKNWQFGRGKREALSTENREHFSLFPYNLAFFSQVRLYVIMSKAQFQPPIKTKVKVNRIPGLETVRSTPHVKSENSHFK